MTPLAFAGRLGAIGAKLWRGRRNPVRKESAGAERKRDEKTHRPISKLVFVIPGALILVLGAWGAFTHWQTSHRAATAQRWQADFRPSLRVAQAKREDGPVKLTLPGATQPYDIARLYARATGYIAERKVDIGSRVRQGDLLIRIDAPDLTAQLQQAAAQLGQMQAALNQAQANVGVAQSNVDLARVTNYRTSTLANLGWETRQNADNTKAGVQSGAANVDAAKAAVNVAAANVAAQLATVQRYQSLVGYLQVTAPFDGVITARNVDTGDLVSADSGGSPLFTIQQEDIIRVQVPVPQSYAMALRDGLKADVHVPELPGRAFEGTISRNAVALDPASRTVLIEVDLPNPDGTLRPGTYITADLWVPRASPHVVVPSDAILFNGKGLRVAIVDGDGDSAVVRMRDVTIARDFGTSVELKEGLGGGERVALSPPVDLADGQRVQVKADPPDGETTKPK